MPTDFEERIARSLHDQAGQGRPIDPAPLMHGAKAQGQRIQVRRRIGGGVLAAVVALGLGFAAVRVNTPQSDSAAPPLPAPAGSGIAVRPESNLAQLPTADIPGATAVPNLVGTDPKVLHLDVNALLSQAREVIWTSNRAYEQATVNNLEDGAVAVAIARNKSALPKQSGFFDAVDATWTAAAPIVVGSVTGTYRTLVTARGAIFHIDWQPAPGLWAAAQVTPVVHGQNQLGAVQRSVSKIRFDRGTPCALPVQVSAPPSGTTLRSCEVQFDAGEGPSVFFHGLLTYGDAARHLDIDISHPGERPQTVKRTIQAGPYKVRKDDDKDNVMYAHGYDAETGGLLINLDAADQKNPWSEAQLLGVFASLQIVGDPDKPATFK